MAEHDATPTPDEPQQDAPVPQEHPEQAAPPSPSPEAQKAQQQAHMGQFRARPANVSDKPRRVRAGRKIPQEGWFETRGWAGERWLEAIKRRVLREVWTQGIDYAQRGQTRRIETVVGGADADVQGRPYRPYTTELMLRPFPHEQWDEAVRELVRTSIHAAKLLSGEMTPAVQDEVFAPLGLDLFPTGDDAEIRCVCNCRETGAWCKHGVCVALLLAEDIDTDPFLLFRLRGLEGEDLIEKLRQRRELESTGSARHSSALRLPFPGDEVAAPPIESCVDEFWDPASGLDEIETTPRRPEVAHALLRRLGPTPFDNARFPLSGLLATCYDTFTQRALWGESKADTTQRDDAPAPSETSSGPKLSAAARMLRAKVAGKAGAKAKPKAGAAKARKPGD